VGGSWTRFGPSAGKRCICAFALTLVIGGVDARAQSADNQYLTVIVGSDTTIRQVAEEYLSDPDLWPEILRTSGIETVADLHPGMELRIPVNEISAANQALIESLGQIQKANEAGAQIFAPDNIGLAVDLHEQAQQKRLERQWASTKELAVASYAEATTAIERSEAQRDQKGEALVSDRNGQVEGQRPEDLSWRDLQLKTVLIEEEKVRTLSNSTAQITFRDASRLRLNANSNAVIKVMRFDPLSNTEEAQVSLVEGDFYALLAGDNTRSKFNVEIPDVNANIDSGNFWVSNDARNAKFTNYDDREVSVAANGETVTLGRNEGTVVARGERPAGNVALLPSPAPTLPADESLVYESTPELAWLPVAESAGYWLEIATDQEFNRVVDSQFGLDEPRYVTGALVVGDYFWRVSALDGFGLPGERSPTFRFRVAPDNTPPYLKIETPAGGAILRKASAEVTGESEPGAVVTVAGVETEVSADSRFAATVELVEGANTIVIVATDPAGNETRGERQVVYSPDTQSIVAFDQTTRQIAPLHFITNDDVLSLGGTTTANAEIEVRSGNTVRASAVTDPDGVFRLNVPLTADEEAFDFAVIASSGFATAEKIAVSVDRDPPQIALDEILPRLTADASLHVAGTTEADAMLTLNGREIALDNGRFDETVTLQTGENTIELIATDVVGNVKIEKSVVKLDQEPPLLVSSTAAPTTNAGRQVLSVTVAAEDASGLAKAAPFVVATASGNYTGYLRYNKAAKAYEALVVVPEAELGGAKLAQVELRDDAGNSKIFDEPGQFQSP
jgi:Glucodextranase, domain B/FecR protein